MKEIGRILLIVLLALPSLLKSQPVGADTLSLRDSARRDTQFRFTGFPGVIDSLRNDSLAEHLRGKWQFNPGSARLPKDNDPWSPFANTVYLRDYSRKAWFMFSSLLALGLLMGVRELSPSGLRPRFRSIFNSFVFKDLLYNMKSPFTLSNLLSIFFTLVIWAQTVVVLMQMRGYDKASNTLVFFLTVLLILLLYRVMVFFAGNFFCYSLNQTDFQIILEFRHLNSDLIFSIGLFPLVSVLYYSPLPAASAMTGVAMISWIFGLYMLARFVMGVVNNIGRGYSLYFLIAYFCALEILPVALLIRLISNLNG